LPEVARQRPQGAILVDFGSILDPRTSKRHCFM
jgi:hypothetical protein